jgi:rhamnogalacturonan acetylesterase
MNRIFVLIFLGIFIFQDNTTAKQKPAVFIIGDSTVKNGRGDGAGGLWGWGDLIFQYFDTTKIIVENHALGGTSSRTYQTKGLWEKVLNRLKKGDFVLMQFGHNDGGAINDTARARGSIRGIGEETAEIDNLLTKQHETVHSYGWYMRKMVRETKAKGATPVIITPVPRNDWENGKIKRTPNSYPQWAMEVVGQEKIHFINLNELVAEKYEELGMESVKAFFPADHTHTNRAGAELNAKILVREACRQKNNKLRK